MSSKNKVIILLVITIVLGSSVLIYIKMQPSEKYEISYISKCTDGSMSFWKTLHMGMEAGAKEYGVDLEITGPLNEADIKTQNQKILEAIEKKPDAIILSAASYDKQLDYSQKIVESGIPLITVDSDIDCDARKSYIATNNYEAGYAAADAMLSLENPPKNVMIINAFQDASSLKERDKGAIARLSENEDINITGPYYCDTNVDVSYEICKEAIINNPTIDGIIGLNEVSLDGAVKALEELDPEGKISLVGIDSSERIIKGLEEGTVDKLIVQKPYNMGYVGIKTAVEVLEGKQVEPFIDTGFQIIDKENMYTKENQKLLFIFAEGQ